ncbi:MAG: DUF4266 domain-containing protein [Saprospiraceae bacterium]|nr:DUF4266 domain-containing protein [Saprospiraceae bacterium]
MRKSLRNIALFSILASMNSCISVKSYQKMYLNDYEMALAAKKLEVFEINFETYREGASGANGGKVGGGCGCN